MPHRRCTVQKNLHVIHLAPSCLNKKNNPPCLTVNSRAPATATTTALSVAAIMTLSEKSLNRRLQLFWETKKKPTKAKMSWRRMHGHHSCSFPPQSSMTTTNHTHSNVCNTRVHQTDRLSCHHRNHRPSNLANSHLKTIWQVEGGKIPPKLLSVMAIANWRIGFTVPRTSNENMSLRLYYATSHHSGNNVNRFPDLSAARALHMQSPWLDTRLIDSSVPQKASKSGSTCVSVPLFNTMDRKRFLVLMPITLTSCEEAQTTVPDRPEKSTPAEMTPRGSPEKKTRKDLGNLFTKRGTYSSLVQDPP